MKKATIYLDNAATTIVDPEVLALMDLCHSKDYGNASSIHHKGTEARARLDWARKVIASSIKASPEEIVFTSGGTESNNLALKGIGFAGRRRQIIISAIEHDCILNSCRWLGEQGYEIVTLPVDSKGFVSPDKLRSLLSERTALVSIIHGNNEIGTIQDIQSLYSICREKGIYFHTDACQSYTKTALSADWADLITMNAHKLHGPKGVGALFIKKGVRITPWQHGGGHERSIRSGTENVPGIVGFAKAVELALKPGHNRHMQSLRDYFIESALKIPGTMLNGPAGRDRLCNNVNMSFRHIEGESLISFLDNHGICTSTGSACSSQSLEPSHVIMALEDNPERAHGSVRFTLGRFTQKTELDLTLLALKKGVEKLRRISPLE